MVGQSLCVNVWSVSVHVSVSVGVYVCVCDCGMCMNVVSMCMYQCVW